MTLTDEQLSKLSAWVAAGDAQIVAERWLVSRLLDEHAEQKREIGSLREYRDADLAYVLPYKTHDEELIAWKRMRDAVKALEAHDASRAAVEAHDDQRACGEW